jgi:branched-chain amino acid transport system ATP-binding protein
MSAPLTVNSVSVSFGGLDALRDVTLATSPGRVTGLIGPNGAGKTTLFNVICGLQSAKSGSIHLGDADVSRMRTHRRARLGLARTFQRLETFGSLTVRENLQVAAEATPGRASVDLDALLERVGLSAVTNEPVDKLPTGTARLVEVGRALATEPKVLLLDEPSSGLDGEETGAFGDLLIDLADDGLAVLLVEHDVELVMRACADIFVLDFGEVIASGEPGAIREDPAVRRAYLGGDV